MLLLAQGVPGCPNRPAPMKRVKPAASGAYAARGVPAVKPPASSPLDSSTGGVEVEGSTVAWYRSWPAVCVSGGWDSADWQGGWITGQPGERWVRPHMLARGKHAGQAGYGAEVVGRAKGTQQGSSTWEPTLPLPQLHCCAEVSEPAPLQPAAVVEHVGCGAAFATLLAARLSAGQIIQGCHHIACHQRRHVGHQAAEPSCLWVAVCCAVVGSSCRGAVAGGARACCCSCVARAACRRHSFTAVDCPQERGLASENEAARLHGNGSRASSSMCV
jgi:hypothetical protein